MYFPFNKELIGKMNDITTPLFKTKNDFHRNSKRSEKT